MAIVVSEPNGANVALHKMQRSKVTALQKSQPKRGSSKLVHTQKHVIPKGYDEALIRPLARLDSIDVQPNDISAQEPPHTEMVRPEDLWLDHNYQREFLPANMTLLQEIIEYWDWDRFRAPNCVRQPDGRLFIRDGQTTALGALHHPQIDRIPVLVKNAKSLEKDAEAFVALNDKFIPVENADKFTARLLMGDPVTRELARILNKFGIHVLRSAKRGAEYGKNETTCIGAFRRLLEAHGSQEVEQICEILRVANFRPIRFAHLHAVRKMLKEGALQRNVDIARIGQAINSIDDAHALAEATVLARRNGRPLSACLAHIYEHRYKRNTR